MTKTKEKNETQKKVRLNPFFTFNVQCPICGSETTQRKIKNHFFAVAKYDLDAYPLGFQWIKDGIWVLKPKEPRLFYLFHCPNCKFTASEPFFRDPAIGYSIRQSFFISSLKAALKNNSVKKVINTLSKNIHIASPNGKDYELVNHLEAIKLYFIAIFQLEVIEKIRKMDSFDIAKYYIQLAWLFRDIEESKELSAEFSNDIKKLCQFLKNQGWKETPFSYKEALELGVHYYEVAFTKSRHIQNTLDEVRFVNQLIKILVKLKNMNKAHTLYLRLIETQKKFEEKTKQFIDNVEKEIFERKSKKVLNMNKEELQDYAMLAKKDEENRKTINKMHIEGRKINSLMDNTQFALDELKDEIEQEELLKAKAILKKIEGASLKEKRAKLEKEKISISIIEKLLGKAKKKVFGIF